MFKLLSQREKIFLMVIAVLIIIIASMAFDKSVAKPVIGKTVATTTPMVLTDISNSLKERVKQEAINIEIKVWEINEAKE